MKKKMTMVLTIVLMMAAIPVSAADVLEGFAGGEESNDKLSVITDVSMYQGIDEPAEVPAASDSDADIKEKPAMEAHNLASQGFYDVSVTGTMVRSEVEEFVRLLNEERTAMGRPPVRLDQEMMEIAEARAAEGSLVYDHIRPDGSSGFQWDEAAQLTSSRDSNAAYLLQRWKESAAHWDGITDTYSTRFGLGIYDQGTGVCSVYACLHQDKSGTALKPYSGTLSDTVETYSFAAGNQYINFIPGDSFVLEKGKSISIRPKTYIVDAVDIDGNPDPNCYSYFNNDNGIWVSDDPSVASIDGQGNLAGMSEGSTTIHFYLNGDRDKSYDARVEVSGEALPVTLKGNYIYRGSERLYGWIQDGGDTYYTDPSTGIIQTGFVEADGEEYFFVPTFFNEYKISGTDQTFAICTMLKDVTLAINGQWYCFAADGTFSRIAEPTPIETPTPSPTETPTPEPDPKPVVPVPAKLKATADTKQIKLSWQPVNGADGYVVYEYANSNLKNITKKYAVSKNSLSLQYQPGTARTFVVRAYQAIGGKNIYCKAAEAIKNRVAAATKPQASTIKKVTAGRKAATVTVKPGKGATGAAYCISYNGGKTYQIVAKGPKGIVGSTNYTMKGLKNGKALVRIRGYVKDHNGKTVYGDWSSPKQVGIK